MQRRKNLGLCHAILVIVCIISFGTDQAQGRTSEIETAAKSKLLKLQRLLEGKEHPQVVREFLDFILQGEDRFIIPLSLESPDKTVLTVLHLGAVPALTDLISTFSDRRIVAWASESLAVMCKSSKLCREEAKKAGTVTTLLRTVKKGSGLDEDKTVTAAICEALCSLVFANQDNHQEAVRRGAVASMMNMALKGEDAVSKMWAMAALHYLAEDYCLSSTGKCPWVSVAYQARGLEPDRRGHSDLNAKLLVDSSAVRLTMTTLGLIGEVARLVEAGPLHACPGNLTRSDAALRSANRLSGWAAAAVLKSLALTPALQPRIVAAGGARALGRIRKGSCWLEKEEAAEALERMMSVASTRQLFSDQDWEAIWDSSTTKAIGGARWREQLGKEEL